MPLQYAENHYASPYLWPFLLPPRLPETLQVNHLIFDFGPQDLQVTPLGSNLRTHSPHAKHYILHFKQLKVRVKIGGQFQQSPPSHTSGAHSVVLGVLHALVSLHACLTQWLRAFHTIAGSWGIILTASAALSKKRRSRENISPLLPLRKYIL